VIESSSIEVWPANLIDMIKQVTSSPAQVMTKPELAFELSMSAADLNANIILNEHIGSLAHAIKAGEGTILSYGSEFRLVQDLTKIFGNHPLWNRMKNILVHGSTWPLEPITELQRMTDVREAIAFGNHRGAEERRDVLETLVAKDVHFGYALPLPLCGALLAPMNVMDQNSIDECGRVVEKLRLTHDQSHVFSGSGTSVNSRARKSELIPCVYGAMLRRMLNWAVAARRLYPGVPIYASKID
jgi:hypothetical protein